MSTVRVFCPGINFCAQMFFSFFSVFFFASFQCRRNNAKVQRRKKDGREKEKNVLYKEQMFFLFLLIYNLQMDR